MSQPKSADDPTRVTLPRILALRANAATDRVFLQDAVSGKRWTYRTVHDESLRWAGAFRRAGLAPGERVLTMFSTRIEFFYSWLGLAWLRCADVPINTEYKGDILRHVMAGSAARIMLVQADLLEHVLTALPAAPQVEHLVVLDAAEPPAPVDGVRVSTLEQFLDGAEPLVDPDPPGLHEIVSVVYTSGTTGPSKGVLQTWNQLRINSYYSFPIDEITEEDALYYTTPTFHQGGKLLPYLMAMRGGRFVFRERFTVSDFWADVRAHGITLTTLMGAMAHFVAARPPEETDADNPLRFVQMVPVLPDIDAFKRRFGVEVVTAYGMTEVSCVFREHHVTNANATSCGRPVDIQEVRLVDDLDYEVPAGELGELIVRCAEPWGHNQGYLGMPEATVKAWRNGWFHTGDAFRRDADGRYYFVDRMKDAIRRRGENISSMEVEAIVSTHPDVAQVAAVAVPSEYSEDEVKICVVRREGSKLAPDELITYLVPLMPRFMVPRFVEFVESLPQTANAKTKKALLRAESVNERTWDREKSGITLAR